MSRIVFFRIMWRGSLGEHAGRLGDTCFRGGRPARGGGGGREIKVRMSKNDEAAILGGNHCLLFTLSIDHPRRRYSERGVWVAKPPIQSDHSPAGEVGWAGAGRDSHHVKYKRKTLLDDVNKCAG